MFNILFPTVMSYYVRSPKKAINFFRCVWQIDIKFVRKYTPENTEGAIKLDNLEKLATYSTQDKTKTQHNMYWTPPYANKHK